MEYRDSFISDGYPVIHKFMPIVLMFVPKIGTAQERPRVRKRVTESELLSGLESLIKDNVHPVDEPATWCTCDDCLSLDRRLRGGSCIQLLQEPLVMLNLSPGVLSRSAFLHYLPALMIGSICHAFGSDELRRGVAFELMTQAGVVESLGVEARPLLAAFLRWAAKVEDERGLFAPDYLGAATALESGESLEARPSFAVTW
jgi:hypothetical protein